jgi:cation transport ATPase
MYETRTILLAQALISLMMAFLMTGFFSWLEFGFVMEWLKQWASNFVVAWPVAFCLSVPVSKIAFELAVKIRGQQKPL